MSHLLLQMSYLSKVVNCGDTIRYLFCIKSPCWKPFDFVGQNNLPGVTVESVLRAVKFLHANLIPIEEGINV